MYTSQLIGPMYSALCIIIVHNNNSIPTTVVGTGTSRSARFPEVYIGSTYIYYVM